MKNKIQIRKNIKAWIKALRSGKFKKGRGFLNSEGKMCCLGVACETLGLKGKESLTMSGMSVVTYGRCSTRMLPYSAQGRIGLRTDNGLYEREKLRKGSVASKYRALTSLNDSSGKTFKQIATFIEKQCTAKGTLFRKGLWDDK
jgi:hypothetical protein